MSKSARPDRKNSRRREKREPSEFEETTLSVDRVTRVVKGGRRMRFRAVVIIGNKKGKVGLGTGKAGDVQMAVKKAAANAKRNLILVPLTEGTIPHEIDYKFKAARLRLMPARDGTGVIAGGALRTVLEHSGVQNVLSKRYGTTNKLVNAQAVIEALKLLKPVKVKAAPQVDSSTEAESVENQTEGEVKNSEDEKADALESQRKTAASAQ